MTGPGCHAGDTIRHAACVVSSTDADEHVVGMALLEPGDVSALACGHLVWHVTTRRMAVLFLAVRLPVCAPLLRGCIIRRLVQH